MLEFKRPQPVPDKEQPRWSIGVDQKRVAAYVAIALCAGIAIGFGAARTFFKTDPRLQPQPDPPPTVAAKPAQPAVQLASPEFHRVTRIIRADTIEVEGIGTVRMIGVETPDGKAPRESYAVHGQNALSYVEKALLGQDVRLDSDNGADALTRDDSGQLVAYVYTRDGRMINSELVRMGLAFVKGAEQFRASNDFRLLERDAVQNSRGVWGPSSSDAFAASRPGPAPDERSRKLAPLPPSALGANIPAITTGSPSPSDDSVFVSAADRMYHKAGCELLDKKKHAISVSQAKAEGFTACSRCFASTVLKAP